MITRYDHTEEDVMEARPDGEFVRFSDHEAEVTSLSDENKNLEGLILVLRGYRTNILCPRCRVLHADGGRCGSVARGGADHSPGTPARTQDR